jgi:tRNA threonylcarbamoyladenosine biosynthesis protein TsaB
MKILAIDTSGRQAQVAVVDNAKIVRPRAPDIPDPPATRRHSEKLLLMVKEILDGEDMVFCPPHAVAYTCGPGSFTGLRIGAATALGLARGYGLPVIPVPTLDAMAYTGIVMRGLARVVPVVDARRGQVYAAVYESGQDPRSETVIPVRISDYMEGTEENVYAMAAGATPLRDPVDPAAVGLWAAYLARGPGGTHAASQAPPLLYVRAPEAVRTREKNENPQP